MMQRIHSLSYNPSRFMCVEQIFVYRAIRIVFKCIIDKRRFIDSKTLRLTIINQLLQHPRINRI